MRTLTFRALFITAPYCLSSLAAILYPDSYHLNTLSFGITGLPAVACTTSIFPAHTPLLTPFYPKQKAILPSFTSKVSLPIELGRQEMVSGVELTCCRGAGHAFLSSVK